MKQLGQPVRLSDALVLDARFASELDERSIAGQIEFWAALGRSVDALLRGRDALALKQRGATKPLSECIAEINAPVGHQRVQAVLQARPFPHFEAASQHPGWLIRIEADGTRILGRIVDDSFVARDPDES